MNKSYGIFVSMFVFALPFAVAGAKSKNQRKPASSADFCLEDASSIAADKFGFGPERSARDLLYSKSEDKNAHGEKVFTYVYDYPHKEDAILRVILTSRCDLLSVNQYRDLRSMTEADRENSPVHGASE
jgi:hypothetical protein